MIRNILSFIFPLSNNLTGMIPHSVTATKPPSMACRPAQPLVTGQQGQIVVHFPLRRGADLAALLEDTAAAFGQLLGGSVMAKAGAPYVLKTLIKNLAADLHANRQTQWSIHAPR